MKVNLSRRFYRLVSIVIISVLTTISIAQISFATTIAIPAGLPTAPAVVSFTLTEGRSVALPNVYPGQKINGREINETVYDCQIVEGLKGRQSVRDCGPNDKVIVTIRGSLESINKWVKIFIRQKILFTPPTVSKN